MICHYSLITNSDEDTTTVVSFFEGSNQKRLVHTVMTNHLPYHLAGISIHEHITMNVQNIFGDDLFNADLRAKDEVVMTSAECCILI